MWFIIYFIYGSGFYYIYGEYYIYSWLLLHLVVSVTVMVDYYIYGWYSKPAGSWWLNLFAIYPVYMK